MTTVSTGGSEPTAIGANDQDLATGHEVGEYRIDGQLGRGGFGTVYAATQPLIGKRVAIKVLARKYSADPEIVSRFVAEARAVNQIRHRNIIDIFSFGQLADGRHYYVMEYLDGEPLDAHIRNQGPMPLDEALPVLRAIARALDAAHAKGIAHRDLKPENIFLAQDPDGTRYPKLLDFGIAKLLAPEDDVRHKTGTGVPIGTPYYMSPEQCRGREIDHRTDIYSFGIVVYRVLTGTFPFEGDDYMELLVKQMNDEAPPPSSRNSDLTPHVDEAIAWMMRKDRTQRPPNVIEGVNALDPSQAMTPAALPKRSSRPTVQPRIGGPAHLSSPDALAATYTPEFQKVSGLALPTLKARRVWPLALAGVVVLAAGGGAAVMMLRSNKPMQPVAAPAAAQPAAQPAAPGTAVPTPPTTAAQPATPAVTPPGPEPSPPVVDEPAPIVEPGAAGSDAKRHVAKKPPRPATPVKATKPAAATPDGETPSTKSDIINLGSDAFSKDK